MPSRHLGSSRRGPTLNQGVMHYLANKKRQGETVATPKLAFRHIDEVPSQEVRAQMHGDQRVGVHLRFMEWSPTRIMIFTEYDPGLVLEAHSHKSDHIIYVTKGSVNISGTECTPGMMVLLEQGAVFGPMIAGPEGTELIEFYTGDCGAIPANDEAYRRLLEEKGITLEPHPPFDPTLIAGND